MAYLDTRFSSGAAGAIAAPVDIAALFGAQAATRLSMLERQVVTLSRRDTLASLSMPTAGWRLLARLFGLRGLNPLADPRLEALRAYAVKLRHGGDDHAAGAASAMVECGYTVDQVAHARWLVAREKIGGDGAGLSPVMTVIVLLVAGDAGLMAANATHDHVVGMVLALMLAVTLAPVAAMRGRRGL